MQGDIEENIGYEMPRKIKFEQAILGSMMLNSDARGEAIDALVPDDFYLQEHREIFKTLAEMEHRDQAVDETTLADALEQKKLLDLVGGRYYILQLMEIAVAPSAIETYINKVLSASMKRKLIKASADIRDKAYVAEEAEDAVNFAEQQIMGIARTHRQSDFRMAEDVLGETTDEIRERQKSGNKMPGIPTGFIDLDRKLGGLQRSDMIVLAARPGMGKTAFALNIGMNAAMNGNSVMVFSMEMSSLQLGQRLLSMKARVPLADIKNGDIDTEDWMSIDKAMGDLYDKNLAFDESTQLSILEMKNKCRRFKMKRGLDLVIIDYLQLMKLPGYSVDSREKEISALTRSIKLMAKELDCAVILLSQLSRDSERSNKKQPQLHHLRDSGAIEQDADIVIFLKRNSYYQDEDDSADTMEEDNICEVNIAKHRNGPTGSIELVWVEDYTKFENKAHGQYED